MEADPSNMNTDHPSFANRLRSRDVTQPITKSARESFFNGSDHQPPCTPVQSTRCSERRPPATPPFVANRSPSGLSSRGAGCGMGMTGHPGQTPSIAHRSSRYPLSPPPTQQRGPTCPISPGYVIGSETPAHSVPFHFQDNAWTHQPSHYISFELPSPPPFPPSYSASSVSPPPVHHNLNSIRTHQCPPHLSFVPSPVSPAAPPISDPFSSSPNLPFCSNLPFTPHSPSVLSPVFHYSQSPVFFPPGCSPTSPDHLHSNSFNQSPSHNQYHHLQCSPHSHSRFPPSASVPRSFLVAPQHPQHQQRSRFDLPPPPVFNLNPVKRPFNVNSKSISGKSRQDRFTVAESSPKHQRPTKTDRQGLFDYLQPYLYSSDPFNLENSPELYHPYALVFPTAKQELDPDFRRFPKGPELSDPHKDKMVNKVTEKTQASSNHNLVGHRIDGGRLELMSVLGLGAYGVVYLAKDLSSPDMDHPRLYAVKALNKIGLDARQKSFQRREIALHSLASSHSSIVTLHAVIESPSCIFVILDYCPDGDLFGMITDKQKYLDNPELVKKVFNQIVEAVEFCHRAGISHRDLKPENILCKKGGEHVVLADFGLATSERTSTDFGCGSTFYMSPECQGGLFQRLGSYSTVHNDIWSLGVILVNLTCGRNPWKQASPTDETFRAYLTNPEFLRSILPVSDACNQILKRIFVLNPVARISLAELKAEISKVKSFNMTADELINSTKATREAARAWRQDVPPSPKLQLPSTTSSWKNTLAKKAKKNRNQNDHDASAPRNHIPAEGNVWDQPVRYEESSSSSSTTFYDNESTDSSTWNLSAIRQTRREHLLQSQLRSPINALREGRGERVRDAEDSTPRIRFVSPPQTPRTAHRSHAQKANAGHVPTGPLVSAFTSASISSSSSSSGERIKKTRGFASRFGTRKHVNTVSTIPVEPVTSSSTRKKLIIKPSSFARPNAPSPIMLKPTTPESSASSSSSSSRLATPTSRIPKHPTLTFLPSTPPSSASPNTTTFGFARKPAKFFRPEMPLTPSTPTHPSGSPPRRKVNHKLPPVGLKKKNAGDKFSLFSSSDEEGSEGGAKVDADFDVDEDDEDGEGGYRNAYPAYAEWAMINEEPVTVKA